MCGASIMEPRRPKYLTCCVTLLLFVTGCGRGVSRVPPAVPQRIVSVVPTATEMLFAIGAGNRVIAVGDFDHFPPEVNLRPRIGGLLNPNVEKIIDLKPDLVITYGTQDTLRERLSVIGIRLYPFTHGTTEQTLSYMIELGKTVGEAQHAQEIADRIRGTFKELRESAPANVPRVLLVHSRGTGLLGSFYSVGNKAFQHELIEIGGGRNIFSDQDREVVQPTLEEVIQRAPEIIIETIPPPAGDAEIEQRRRDWFSLKSLPATTHQRVYVIAEDYLLVPGPRLDIAAKKFAELIRR